MDLTALHEILAYDPTTGIFTWKVARTGTAKAGTRAGSLKKGGYRQILLFGKRVMEHRLAFVFMTGSWPHNDVDHINGICGDNRWCNLRDVTTSVNMQNQRRPFSNKNGKLLGAYWHKRLRRWQACIMTNGKLAHIGYFDTEADAHAAYLDVKRRVHEGCTI